MKNKPICPKCGIDVREESPDCNDCNERLERMTIPETCLECGKEFFGDSLYCEECLDKAPVFEPKKIGMTKRIKNGL